ncbi:MAG: Hsp20/alpha crystallin family protein [Rubricoccaceae bacterium]
MSSLIRYSGAPGIMGLRRDIDRLFDELFSGGENGNVEQVWSPRTDLSETDEGYVIRMDVPGISREDISVDLHEGTLTVSGSRTSEHEEKNEKMHRVERFHGRFFRSFALPQAGDSERVSARLTDGVLTIEVPKREESRPRRIEVG